MGSSRVGTGGAIATLDHTRMERMQVMRGRKGIEVACQRCGAGGRKGLRACVVGESLGARVRKADQDKASRGSGRCYLKLWAV